MKRASLKFLLMSALTAILLLSIPYAAEAQGLGPIPTDIGHFSAGLGLYQAPSDAISDSGMYGLVRYEISSFEFEIDYGVSDQPFFLGAADYLYIIPTAEGVTQTSIALGGGITFVNNDPALDGSETGFNILGKIKFMDSFDVQVRHDFLGGDANLWTFGVSYSFN